MELSITNVIAVSDLRHSIQGDAGYRTQQIVTLTEGPFNVWSSYSPGSDAIPGWGTAEHADVVNPRFLSPAGYLVMHIAGEIVRSAEFLDLACKFGLTTCHPEGNGSRLVEGMDEEERLEWEEIATGKLLPAALASVVDEVHLGITRLNPQTCLDDEELELLADVGIDFQLFTPENFVAFAV